MLEDNLKKNEKMELYEPERLTVTFEPIGKKVAITRETNLLEAARLINVPLVADCGGMGVCGRCKVELLKGEVHQSDIDNLSAEDVEKGFILACTAYPVTDVSVKVPKSSVPVGMRASFSGADSMPVEKLPYKTSPMVEKHFVEVEPPSADDNLSDLDRLYVALKKKTGIGEFTINHKALMSLSRVVREARWKVTAAVNLTSRPPTVNRVEKGDTSFHNYGIVVDIGTTTLEAFLVHVPSGQIRFFASHPNPQEKYGADIMARLNFASRGNGLLVLNDIIIDKVNEILMELIVESNIEKEQVHSMVICGNTVMIHLLMGLDTDSILRRPQTPVGLRFPVGNAYELNLYANPYIPVFISPGVGTYAGGDLVASLVYTGMPDDDFMLVDIGTNGEVALVHQGAVICASTSAGPAFEGGGVKWGMRATIGAINRVHFSETHHDFILSTIGNETPKGICGTGLIDTMATLFRAGFLDRKGHFRGRRKTSRIRSVRGLEEFVLAFSPNEEHVISITEQDVGYLVKSKGAIYTGCDFLLKRFGLKDDKLDKFYIAGALGGFLNIENGVTIGLFPDLEREKFRFLGNGSLHGGRMMLLSKEAREKAEQISRSAAYFELTGEPEFMNAYSSALFIPHTDVDRFPSVKK